MREFYLFKSKVPQYANINYIETYSDEYIKYFKQLSSLENYFVINGFGTINTILAGIIMKPWDQREQTQKEVQQFLQPALNNVAGLQTSVFPLASFPGGGTGLPVQFVVTSISSFKDIYLATMKMVDAAQKSGLFLFVDSKLKYNNPQLNIYIDRDKSGDLGINMANLGQILAYSLSGNCVNHF